MKDVKRSLNTLEPEANKFARGVLPPRSEETGIPNLPHFSFDQNIPMAGGTDRAETSEIFTPQFLDSF
jgi:hypothetical protein